MAFVGNFFRIAKKKKRKHDMYIDLIRLLRVVIIKVKRNYQVKRTQWCRDIDSPDKNVVTARDVSIEIEKEKRKERSRSTANPLGQLDIRLISGIYELDHTRLSAAKVHLTARIATCPRRYVHIPTVDRCIINANLFLSLSLFHKL